MTKISATSHIVSYPSKVAVVIPTFNEAGNILKLLTCFTQEVLPTLPQYDIEIVVVDGKSTDGTAAIVEQYSKSNRKVHLIREEEKTGIGSAYLKGFNFSIQTLKASVVIEFDGDFQHPPEMISALLEKINAGYDLVLGSRSVSGGSEPRGRNPLRLVLTHVGGFVVRLILFFPGKRFFQVTDPTSGLRATRVDGFLDQLDLSPDHLYSKKFGYKIQLLSEILMGGARYTEIPLQFGHRQAGSSKFENDTATDILLTCFKTRLGHR